MTVSDPRPDVSKKAPAPRARSPADPSKPAQRIAVSSLVLDTGAPPPLRSFALSVLAIMPMVFTNNSA